MRLIPLEHNISFWFLPEPVLLLDQSEVDQADYCSCERVLRACATQAAAVTAAEQIAQDLAVHAQLGYPTGAMPMVPPPACLSSITPGHDELQVVLAQHHQHRHNSMS